MDDCCVKYWFLESKDAPSGDTDFFYPMRPLSFLGIKSDLSIPLS